MLSNNAIAYKIRASNLLIATILSYGFEYTIVGHMLGAVTAIAMISSAKIGYDEWKWRDL